MHRAREGDREWRNAPATQAEHCRRKATGKGNADQQMQMQVGGNGKATREGSRPARLRPDGCCCACRPAGRGRALLQWFAGVHADVKGFHRVAAAVGGYIALPF
ncbi:hypothetical protein BDA96_01G127400 [Sorghum bicolor]|uniref:Uncharacterized protein n=1 Tax=Sorghum bicolor TaxID=4558 RepID=A0A921UXF0_SORBI|nr:hypothetical protein BDA96_01G127400 [Sorghum bicolor]